LLVGYSKWIIQISKEAVVHFMIIKKHDKYYYM
jgi:hypothetical protein